MDYRQVSITIDWSRSKQVDNKLMEVKQALADKYTRLFRTASSKVKRRKYANQATAYRRQAEQIARK